MGSFGCTLDNVRQALGTLATGRASVAIADELPLEGFEEGLRRLEDRNATGKTVVRIPD